MVSPCFAGPASTTWAVTRVQIIRSRRVEVRHPFRIGCGTRDNFRLAEMVNAQIHEVDAAGRDWVLSQVRAFSNQRARPSAAHADRRSHLRQRLLPLKRQDGTKYLSGL